MIGKIGPKIYYFINAESGCGDSITVGIKINLS